MLLLVALVIAAVVASDAPASMGKKTADLICKIAHGGQACADIAPPACNITSGTRSASGEIRNAGYVKTGSTAASRRPSPSATRQYLRHAQAQGWGEDGAQPQVRPREEGHRPRRARGRRRRLPTAPTARSRSTGSSASSRRPPPRTSWGSCASRTVFRNQPKVDFPPVESFTVNGDTTVNLPPRVDPGTVRAEAQVGGRPGRDGDPGDRQGRGSSRARSARRTSARARVPADDRLLRGEQRGRAVGDVVIGPLVNAALGGKLTGKARVAITVDATGKPLSLSVINTVEGEVNGGLKNSRSTTFGDIADTIPFYAREVRGAKGKGTEITTTLDLTDPRLAAAAQRAWTGRDPVTGEPVDRSDAAGELGQAARDASRFTLRTYDYDKTTDRHDVDLVVAGGAAEFGGRNDARPLGQVRPRDGSPRGPTAARADRDALRPRAARRLRQRRAEPAARASVPPAPWPSRTASRRCAGRAGHRRARRLRPRAAHPGGAARASRRAGAEAGCRTAVVREHRIARRLRRRRRGPEGREPARALGVPAGGRARRAGARRAARAPRRGDLRAARRHAHAHHRPRRARRRGVRYAVFARAPEADFARLRLAEAVDSFRVDDGRARQGLAVRRSPAWPPCSWRRSCSPSVAAA